MADHGPPVRLHMDDVSKQVKVLHDAYWAQWARADRAFFAGDITITEMRELQAIARMIWTIQRARVLRGR